MEENFNVIAQSRANYYTPGSPVQFVRIEVLKGDQSGDNAICLTFKNIAPTTVTRLSIAFKCKGADGTVLCEQTFHYEDLEVKSGELFGMNDAVFVSSAPIGSADVVLEKVYSGKRVMTLDQMKRVRLPLPQKLEADLGQELARRIGRNDLRYMPQLLEGGWYCACGAFHPNEENTVYCSECSSDRILLQNTINAILQPAVAEQDVAVDEPTMVATNAMATEATVVAPTLTKQAPAKLPVPETVEDATVQLNVARKPAPERTQRVAAVQQPKQATSARSNARYDDESYDDYGEDEYEDPRDVVAENIIRWVPALTALLCAGIAIAGFCYCFFVA